MKYAVIIEQTGTGFSAYVPDLPGCVATSKTLEQLRARLQSAARIHLKSMWEDGDSIPEATTRCEYLEFQLAS